MKTKLLYFSFILLTIIVSACAPLSAAAPVVPVTGSSKNTPAAVLPAGPAVVDVSQNAALGSFLVDSKGMTLYIYTKDAPNVSNCSGACAGYWPPYLTNGAPVAGSGVSASMLGVITRSDGSTQVTYNSMPLYFYAGDNAVGDVTGQGFKNIWYVIDPTGKSVIPAPAAAVASPSASAIPTTAIPVSGGGAIVNVGQAASLGSFLVDSKGMTLYTYTYDSPNTSACYGSCGAYWMPLLTSGAPIAGTGVTAGMLGTTQRTDGTTQVTYNGWPLYSYVGDHAAGDISGEGSQGYWFVITPAGAQK